MKYSNIEIKKKVVFDQQSTCSFISSVFSKSTRNGMLLNSNQLLAVVIQRFYESSVGGVSDLGRTITASSGLSNACLRPGLVAD